MRCQPMVAASICANSFAVSTHFREHEQIFACREPRSKLLSDKSLIQMQEVGREGCGDRGKLWRCTDIQTRSATIKIAIHIRTIA